MSIHPVPNERAMSVPLVELIDVARYFDVSPPWLNRVIERKPRQILRVVDLRDGVATDELDAEPDEVGGIVAVVETEHDRRVRQIQAKLNRLRTRLALSVAPPAEAPAVPRPSARRLSAKQAGRTAP